MDEKKFGEIAEKSFGAGEKVLLIKAGVIPEGMRIAKVEGDTVFLENNENTTNTTFGTEMKKSAVFEDEFTVSKVENGKVTIERGLEPSGGTATFGTEVTPDRLYRL